MFHALTQRPCRAMAVMVLALGLAGTVNADTTRRIQFAGGSDHAEVSDKIKGYDGASFLVGASAGQTLKVEMSSPNGAAYFNVTAPGANEAMFIGSISGERFEGTLPVSGDYRIDVYMMRSAARRGAGRGYSSTVAQHHTQSGDRRPRSQRKGTANVLLTFLSR